METNFYNLEIVPNNEPFLNMLIEPENKYRFRYASEGGSHGGLAGRERNKGKKTYPTVQLVNYNGSCNDIFIRVTLCTEKRNDHVLQFKEKKSSESRSLDDSFCAVFKDLAILIPKKEDVYDILLNRKIQSLGRNLSRSARDKFEKEIKEDIKKEAKEIFNSVVLKFDTFEIARPNVQICPSLYSNPICNLKNSSKGELKICRMSSCSGSCRGGEEIILLCEKVQKDNVKIKFYDKYENDSRWEAYASFSPTDVHYQVAIFFRTPPYKDNIEKKVAVCLTRGDEISEPLDFIYIPEDFPPKRRKICEIEETVKQMLLPLDGSSSNSGTGDISTEELLECSSLEMFSKLSNNAENPQSDSNSSKQIHQDLDSPSLELGVDFFGKLDEFLFPGLNDDFMSEEKPVCQSLNLFGDQSSLFNSEDEMEAPMMDAGKIVGQMTVMADRQKSKDTESSDKIDVDELQKQIAVMNLKDSEFNYELPRKVFKNVSRNKTVKDEKKNMEQFLSFRDREGNTLLHLAVLYNRSREIFLKVIKMSNSDIMNAQNNNKQTALHIAVEQNSSVLKELLQNSANPSIKNAKGNNCCHIACQHNFINCLKYILYPRRCHALILQDFNYEGLTPLHVALKNNSLSCLEFLFEKCYYLIDFSAADFKRRTFLHYAVEYSTSYVSCLLNKGEIEINCKDVDGNTPLHLACANGNFEVVKQLIEAGADPGIRNSKYMGLYSEDDTVDEASVGQMPADLTTDSNILNLLKYENPSDVCCNEDKESVRIFEDIAKKLSSLLDPGMRWKKLAMYVLDEKYVTSLVTCSQNPTRTILEYMKKAHGKQYIKQLIALLDMVGFSDEVKVINESCKFLNVI